MTTDKKEEGDTEVEGRQWILGTFSSPQLYTKHEKVVYQGKLYVTLQTHINYGDTTWAPDQADTLFHLN